MFALFSPLDYDSFIIDVSEALYKYPKRYNGDKKHIFQSGFYHYVLRLLPPNQHRVLEEFHEYV